MPKYQRPPKEKIPELMLLGHVGEDHLLLDDGRTADITFVELDSVRYLVKSKITGRWREERHTNEESPFGREQGTHFTWDDPINPIEF